MKILNNKGPKIDLMEFQTISGSTNYICHLFLLFVFYFRGNYALTLKNFCQKHMHLAQQLKGYEADNRKLSINQQWRTKCTAIVNTFLLFLLELSSSAVCSPYETGIDIWTIKNRKKAEFNHRYIFRKFSKYWIICLCAYSYLWSFSTSFYRLGLHQLNLMGILMLRYTG